MKTTVMEIKGMHCDGCAKSLELLVGRIPGVRKVDVSFSEGQARILYDLESASVEDVVGAIERGGFTARPVG